MRARLRRLSDRVNGLAIALCMALIVAMFAISVTGIAWQAATGHALSWSYSLARLFVPWIAMLSVTVAFKHAEHIMVGALIDRAPAFARRMALAVGVASIGLFALAMVWFGARFFADATQLFMVSDFLQVSHRWTAAALPVAGLILLVHLGDGVALLGRPDTRDAS